MKSDGPTMLIVGGGTLVDHWGKKGKRRRKGEILGGPGVLMFEIG